MLQLYAPMGSMAFFFFCLWVSHEVVFFGNFRKLIYMNPVICSVMRDRKVGRSGGECSACGSVLKSREKWDIGCFNSTWRAVGGKGASQPHCALLSLSRCSLSLLSFLSALCLFFLILRVVQECLFFPLIWFQHCRWFYEAVVWSVAIVLAPVYECSHDRYFWERHGCARALSFFLSQFYFLQKSAMNGEK